MRSQPLSSNSTCSICCAVVDLLWIEIEISGVCSWDNPAWITWSYICSLLTNVCFVTSADCTTFDTKHCEDGTNRRIADRQRTEIFEICTQVWRDVTLGWMATGNVRSLTRRYIDWRHWLSKRTASQLRASTMMCTSMSNWTTPSVTSPYHGTTPDDVMCPARLLALVFSQRRRHNSSTPA